MFPDEYISNISERIRLYKELNEIDNEDGFIAFQKKLSDRFGKIPPPAEALAGHCQNKMDGSETGN